MWEPACKQLHRSVHVVIRNIEVEVDDPNTPGNKIKRKAWFALGTAFSIATEPEPMLVTNAHVVTDPSGNILPDLAIVLILGPNPPVSPVAGAAVRILERSLDSAVLVASQEAKQAKPVVFHKDAPQAVGSPVAAFGFPIPDSPQLTTTGGSLLVQRRLATGFVSSFDHPADFPPTPPGLLHYELNMLGYPGLSGAPLFNTQGKVIGMNRGTRLHNQQVAAYALGIRNYELLSFLKRHKLPFRQG